VPTLDEQIGVIVWVDVNNAALAAGTYCASTSLSAEQTKNVRGLYPHFLAGHDLGAGIYLYRKLLADFLVFSPVNRGGPIDAPPGRAGRTGAP
jgi:hypothetical protein